MSQCQSDRQLIRDLVETVIKLFGDSVSFLVIWFVGGLTVDRWFHHVDILMAITLVLYTIVGVSSAYVQNIILLYVLFLLQGTIETWLQTGEDNL